MKILGLVIVGGAPYLGLLVIGSKIKGFIDLHHPGKGMYSLIHFIIIP